MKEILSVLRNTKQEKIKIIGKYGVNTFISFVKMIFIALILINIENQSSIVFYSVLTLFFTFLQMILNIIFGFEEYSNHPDKLHISLGN